MSIRTRNLGALKSQAAELPKQIARYEQQGRQADADRCRSVLAQTRAEIERRENLAVRSKTEGETL